MVAGERVVRIEPVPTNASVMLFDAGRGGLVLLNRAARQYNTITLDRLEALEARVREQRERMQRMSEGK